MRVAAFALVAAAAVAGFGFGRMNTGTPDASAVAPRGPATGEEGGAPNRAVASQRVGDPASVPSGADRVDSVDASGHAAGAPADGDAAREPAWPVVRQRLDGGGGRPAPGVPAIAAELAFAALQYVGVDPEAERTWRRAIDDERVPAGTRSDLIEDLNQEGFHDNSHPGGEDLELVLARLRIIERLAPFARDEVNAAAFEEAYKDLLDMYVRMSTAAAGR